MKKEFVLQIDGAPRGSLAKLKAHWVSRDTILWNVPAAPDHRYSLFYLPDPASDHRPSGHNPALEIPLSLQPEGANEALRARFPHLAWQTALKLPAPRRSLLAEALKDQLAVAVWDANDNLLDAAGVQIAGVLDDLYTYKGPLGLSFSGYVPSLRLWAPTARSVTLHLFNGATAPGSESLPMRWHAPSGMWSIRGKRSWLNKYYLFEVEVYAPSSGRVERTFVTDPYSLSLSTNSRRSQIVDLKAPGLKPSGWDKLVKPPLAAPEDIVVYELHIRDFSISDQSLPKDLRGTYLAFTRADSDGMQHLKALAQAGLTHIHLLPAFDIASVNEDKRTWKTVDERKLAALPPDSDGQARAVSAIVNSDGFNWGYDPYHYTTPEGSYATDPSGSARSLEFREMVKALNQAGLRVVMDVVYNHTQASGLDEKSVLDKVVPGYYHRLNDEGRVESSTCCANTASEHAMMRRLMIDSLLTWAREYKVDGFRFDLMGHHMLADMQAVRAALDALTLERDGVDGKAIYVYGEGWNFGEVANNARGVNATQQNIGGTGIGAFNDRLRDAVRGSSFGDIRSQGYATGLYFQPNPVEWRDSGGQLGQLKEYSDWIRLTLAGNLRDYIMVGANGYETPGRELYYGGQPAAYALDPQENVVYVSAHDNETLWDILQIKTAPEVPLPERVRMHNLALSLVAFSQGVPFFHAGDDLLRSKSLDRNSFNSGDWFNRIDWTGRSNNWGVGLPLEGRDRWDIYRPLLANPALKAGPVEISFAARVFQEYLRIRKSSPLFHLRTAETVQRSVSFLNTGPGQLPGLIIMRLTDADNIDPLYSDILVLFNAAPHAAHYTAPELAHLKLELHPVQAASVDEMVEHADFDSGTGAFSVPGRTTAVFVRKH